MERGMRRVALPCALVLTLALTPAAATQPQASWALQQIRELAAAGVIGSNVARFHPERPLTRGELETLLAALLQTSPSAVAVPTQTVTMAGLDSRLVRALGLLDATRLFQRSARSAGIAPPARFGSEAIARLLGLRTNHPAAADDLELLPSETATRAEAAFSAARILGLPAGETHGVGDEAAPFSLPTLTPWERRD